MSKKASETRDDKRLHSLHLKVHVDSEDKMHFSHHLSIHGLTESAWTTVDADWNPKPKSFFVGFQAWSQVFPS